jgi:adenylyltransferase/sulfurtransferase
MGELEARREELLAWRDRPVVVHCHVGGRSARACEILSDWGLQKIENLRGGIEAWSLTVDPDVPRY